MLSTSSATRALFAEKNKIKADEIAAVLRAFKPPTSSASSPIRKDTHGESGS
jgi:hypothetical protein